MYRTVIQYFDIRSGEEIEQTTTKKRLQNKIERYYDIVRKHKRNEYNSFTGNTTIYITAECQLKQQLEIKFI